MMKFQYHSKSSFAKKQGFWICENAKSFAKWHAYLLFYYFSTKYN